RRRRRLTIVVVLMLALTPVWWSLGSALSNPSLGTTISARFAEWARDHGGGPVVRWAEKEWYTHHQPPEGGKPQPGAIPAANPTRRAGLPGASGLPVPATITPPVTPALPGEGVWHPAGRTVDGVPAIYEAFVRPDRVHTSLVVGVAWMDTKLLRATLYSGSEIPGGGPYAHTAPVSAQASGSLVAAFNAGFKMATANGGYYTDGRAEVPLREGAASFVVYADGSSTVGRWGRHLRMTPSVVSVRQNLDLIVTGGRPVPGLSEAGNRAWGATLGGGVFVPRSGLGVTADGALVYVGGPGLSITTLADLLVRAGAVRAMEMDINNTWVNFAAYAPPTPTGVATPRVGTDLLSGHAMAGTPSRYFQSWWRRDFITMSADPSGVALDPAPGRAGSGGPGAGGPGTRRAIGRR
ncbi:MAG: phosphodiester glycosidase family protein, partial [Acidimicrobiales bacterium]